MHAFSLEDIDTLKSRPIAELRDTWSECFGRPPNRHWGKEILARGIAWRLQEEAFGKMPHDLKLRLDRLADRLQADPNYAPVSRPIFKPGTRLIRDWRGETHEVTVLEKGFAWQGESYKSLSEVAREITGARWSGPRFFGLNGEASHAEI